MKLPNGDRAVVDIRKLTGYALNTEHLRGGAVKAEGFRRALGLTIADAPALRATLLGVAASADARPFGEISQGRLLTVDAIITWENRRALVPTGWISATARTFPDSRLCSCSGQVSNADDRH